MLEMSIPEIDTINKLYFAGKCNPELKPETQQLIDGILEATIEEFRDVLMPLAKEIFIKANI